MTAHDRELPRPGEYSVDARGGLGIQVGDGNTQIIYAYSGGTWTDGVAPPPLASLSGVVESPYRGLNAYGEQDAAFFFGREEASDQVLERMSRLVEGRGLLVVSGASGAGKSSLLRAGVLPRLRTAGLASVAAAASWPCLVLTPGRSPLDELAVRAALLAGTDAAVMRRELTANPTAFALIARQAALVQPPKPGQQPTVLPAPGMPGERRLLLVVDQFEQVFTQCADEAERRAFITAVCAAAGALPEPGSPPSALVVLGVRADFEARCASYPPLAGAVQDRYLVTAMTERQLRMAITGPARAAGSQVDEELAGVLLAEVRAREPGGAVAGVLPLLSHALDQAWRSRSAEDLNLADYERTGGIEAAVATSAERAYGRLTASQQAAARQVFIRLTAINPDGVDTVDRASMAELVEGSGPGRAADVEAVLEAFATERLLTLAGDSVEVSHEALLTAWPLLRDTWLAETHADRIILTRLRATAADWDRRSRDPSYLYRGTLLQAAAETAGRSAADPLRNLPLSQAERDFLRASSRNRRRSARWRQVAIAGLAAFALAASSMALWANEQRSAANRQQAIATQQRDQAIANQLVAEAEQVSSADPSLAAQLLLTAYRRDSTQDIASRLIGTENEPLSTSVAGLGRGVSSVVFSPKGMTLAAISGNTVTLRDVGHPGQPVTSAAGDISVTGGVNSAAFSPDGTILAVGGDTVTLWNVSNPARPRELSRTATATATGTGTGTGTAQNFIGSVAFSPNGTTLATSGDTVTLWNVSNPARPRKLSQPIPAAASTSLGAVANSVNAVAFSPNSTTLAVGGDTVTLWNVANPARPRKLSQPIPAAAPATADVQNFASAVAFSPNGTTLATSGDTVTLWNVSNPARPRKLSQPIPASNAEISFAAAFGPDGTIMATNNDDGTASLWNVSDPAHPRKLSQPFPTSVNNPVAELAFSPDGTIMATLYQNGSVRLWGIPSTSLPTSTSAETVVFSSNDNVVAAAGDTVTLWNVSNPARPRQLSQPIPASAGQSVSSVTISPDGDTLAVGGSGGKVALWDVSTPARPRRSSQLSQAGAGYWVTSAAFDPKGTVLAAASDDGTVRLWDVSDPAHPRQLGQPINSSTNTIADSVAFSPNGHILAAAGDDGTVRLWDVSDPAHPRQLGQPVNSSTADPLNAMAFSPSGGVLAVAGYDGTITLWNVSTPANPRQLGQPINSSPNNQVYSIAFNPKGAVLAAGDGNGTITLWNVSTPANPRQLGQPINSSPNNQVYSIAFNPKGTVLAAGDANGIGQLWDLDVSYAISRICDLTSGTLQLPQWRQYIPQLQYDPPCPALPHT